MKKNIFTFLLLFSLTLTIHGQTLKDEWVVCNNQGCKLLDPYYSDGVTMKWEGACVNGKANGYGKLTKYKDGEYESTYEGEFEIKVYEQLREYVESRHDEADLRIFNQVETCGQKRLDFVVFNQTNQKAVAVEVDGSYHYQENGLSKQYSEEHTERIDILKRAGWNVINTPYYKWYRNGWLCDTNHPTFQREIDRIIDELDYYLL